ncbi:MAG TPA: PAS domain-containing protein [Dongiaceae bacterium]|jgi:hypothetical protein|nr:PAS domain-containing protein [Dongiaceae bacterium]
MIRDRLPLPQFKQLYDYWEGKRAGRRWPRRSDIDPVEMRFALGNIDLVEIAYDPIVFLFRISGSNIDRDEGFNMQGKTLDEYPLPQHREAVRKTYLRVLERGEPDYEELERLDEGQVVRYGRLILPLSEQGDRIDAFLMARYELKAPDE